MTPEEKRRGAFEEFDELLYEGVRVHEAIVRAAEDNEMTPEDFRAIAERELDNLEEHARKLQLRRVNDAISAECKLAMSKRHPTNIFSDGYDSDEVVGRVQQRLGRPITDAEVSRIEEIHRDLAMKRVKSLIEEYR